MLKILCINGAPGVGKDTAGRLLKKNHPFKRVRIMKFATPIDDIARQLLQMNPMKFSDMRETHKHKVLRDYGCQVTLRQLMISISEDLVKPAMGKTWFADYLGNKIAKECDDNELIVVTDSGFQYEYDRFKEVVQGIAEVRLITMTREGHTFVNDSRHQVTDSGSFLINNDGSLDELGQLLSVDFFS